MSCEQEPQEMGERTSDFYKTENIPNRFQNPSWFQGYGGKQQHPMYKTTANSYGRTAPNVHTMPTSFHCKSQKFSQHLGDCGMYKNHSLNTAIDKTKY